MYRFIERATHSTPNARPDLMPLGGVLLALVAIFATHMPQASTRLIQEVGYGGCGLCRDCGQPREISLSQDRHGQVRMDSSPVSIPLLRALLQIEQAQPDAWLVVKVNPVLLGAGIALAPRLASTTKLRLRSTKVHDVGVVVLRYDTVT